MIKNRFHSSIKKKLSEQGGDVQEYNDKEELQIVKNEHTTDNYLKLNLNRRNSVGSNNSQHSTNSHINSPCNNDIIMSDIENMDNRNFNSTLSSKELAESEFYDCYSNMIPYDFLTYDRDVKSEEPMFHSDSVIWNLEDYFKL